VGLTALRLVSSACYPSIRLAALSLRLQVGSLVGRLLCGPRSNLQSGGLFLYCLLFSSLGAPSFVWIFHRASHNHRSPGKACFQEKAASASGSLFSPPVDLRGEE
jgi:hypothetical protein